MGQPAKRGATSEKSRFKFADKANVARNAELRKIDLGARLLMREVSYGSLVAAYLDRVVSDDDKTEALQALLQIFIPPATKLGGGILESPCPSVCPSVCRRARLGKIAWLGIGCRGGYFVPLGQPHSSFIYGRYYVTNYRRVCCSKKKSAFTGHVL